MTNAFIDITKNTVDFQGYLHDKLNRVLFRHLNTILGLKIKQKIATDQFHQINSSLKGKFIVQKSLLSARIGVRRSLQKHDLLTNEQFAEKLTSEVMQLHQEYLDFFQIEEFMLKDDLYSEFLKWVQIKPNDIMKLDEILKSVITNKYPAVKKFLNPQKKLELETLQELQDTFDIIFNIDKFVEIQKKQLEINEAANLSQFIGKLKVSSQYTDLIFLHHQFKSIYRAAILELVITFEEWIKFYFMHLIPLNPERFLNLNGIPTKWLKEDMKKLIKLSNSKEELVPDARLIDLEVEIIGYSGSKLKDYIAKHAGYNIPEKKEIETSFEFYRQLRILRNDLTHPQRDLKSELNVPESVEEFEEFLKRLLSLGVSILEICRITKFSIDPVYSSLFFAL